MNAALAAPPAAAAGRFVSSGFASALLAVTGVFVVVARRFFRWE